MVYRRKMGIPGQLRQILPARDRPVKNFPNRFLGLTVSTNVKARSARIEVHRDLEGNDQDEGTLTAKIASQEVWEKLCDAAKHSEPMQFEVQGTPKDDGTGRVDYEMQSISDVLPGDGAPLIPAV